MSAKTSSGEDTILVDESNTPPGLLESWADYHDYMLELYFRREPSPTEEPS
jgi:hypothetical protein